MAAKILLALALITASFATRAQTFTTLHVFDGVDGFRAEAPLIYANGQLYGTTFEGGQNPTCPGYSCGTVFQVDPLTGAEKALHSFGHTTTDGEDPAAGLLYLNGKLLGTTENGGVRGLGTIFAVDASTGTESILYDFLDRGDGGMPTAALVRNGATLTSTSDLNSGNIFDFDPSSRVLSQLFVFKSSRTQGYDPLSGVIAQRGVVYGASYEGGKYGAGNVYALDPATGTQTVLYNFTGGADGSGPAGIVTWHNGMLYGSTYSGGSGCQFGCGTLYRVDPSTGVETVLYRFTGGADGNGPESGLIFINGVIYGTDRGGLPGCETNGCGTVFRFDPATGTQTTVHEFTGGPDGGLPLAGLLNVNGTLYGTTSLGGNALCNLGNGCGTVFRISVGP